MANLRAVVVLLSAFALANGAKRSSTVIQKSGKEDLQTSESGYSYQIRSGGPFTYTGAEDLPSVQMEAIRYPADEDQPANLEEIPAITMGRYSHNPVPLEYLSLKPKFHYENSPALTGEKHIYPYAQGFDNFLDNMKGGLDKLGKFAHFVMDEPMSYNKPLPLHLKPVKGIPELSDDSGLTKGSNYLASLGRNYENAEKAERGETGSSGYLKEKEFANGLKGKYGHNDAKGFYGLEGGKKFTEGGASNSYADHHQNRKSHRGGAFSDAKGHDKGSKTTGYHKVIVKDEFKKDHSFYDKADKRGNFNKYADYDANAKARQGAFKNGANHNSGFKGVGYSSKGASDKGKFEDENSGYKGAEGEEKYYDRQAEFGNKGGKSFGSVTGYSE